MSHTPLRVPLTVCFLAQNCLAEAYLGQLLHAERRIRPFSLKHYLRFSPAGRRNTIFVIDQCGLDVPLCEYLKQLRVRCFNAKFIVLNHEQSKEEIVRLLVMGAHGYVPHGDASRTLIRAIFSVAANQLWVPHDAFQQFLLEVGSALRKDTDARHSITPRENEILELVRRRLSNREIAELLQIRVCTVKFHLSNILSKLHASSRHDLTEAPSGKLWRMLL